MVIRSDSRPVNVGFKYSKIMSENYQGRLFFLWVRSHLRSDAWGRHTPVIVNSPGHHGSPPADWLQSAERMDSQLAAQEAHNAVG